MPREHSLRRVIARLLESDYRFLDPGVVIVTLLLFCVSVEARLPSVPLALQLHFDPFRLFSDVIDRMQNVVVDVLLNGPMLDDLNDTHQFFDIFRNQLADLIGDLFLELFLVQAIRSNELCGALEVAYPLLQLRTLLRIILVQQSRRQVFQVYWLRLRKF